MNNFYFQFQKVSNNYNQVVKAIHHNFDPVSVRKMLYTLEKLTAEMTENQQRIIQLTEEFKARG